MVKIVDRIHEEEAKKKPYIAFEFYPPRTAEGTNNLTRRFARMLQQSAWSGVVGALPPAAVSADGERARTASFRPRPRPRRRALVRRHYVGRGRQHVGPDAGDCDQDEGGGHGAEHAPDMVSPGRQLDSRWARGCGRWPRARSTVVL